MLESITVKNLALIRESEVLLRPGLNILTGETGAGKSIILGSIRLALGERAGKDVIRHGAEYALIELVFTDIEDEITAKMKELDIPVESDGNVYISRRIMDGRSVCKCNGETITGKALKELASMLINIHGQNDTQALLDARNYRDILDDYAGDELARDKATMKEVYFKYRDLDRKLSEARDGANSRDKDIELARFEVAEIENAKLVIGEDEELEEKYRLMKNGQKIAEALGRANGAISPDTGAGAGIGAAIRELASVCEYDDRIVRFQDNLLAAEDLIRDAARSMSDYIDDMDFSQKEFMETESRLDIINHLKNKYGDSIEDVLAYGSERAEYIARMEDYEGYVNKLIVERDAAYAEAKRQAEVITKIRKQAAKSLESRLIDNLSALNFMSVSFEVEFDSSENNLCDSGYDDIDFLVSFNVGEELKSLSKVASGGELSRFMLALKVVTADSENVGTLIFDEIDSGISGKTAWNVSEKMALLGREHQVIAITHLPQIAAMADTHYLITKQAVDGETVTDINRLDENAHTCEVARLLSGGELTESAMSNAGELLAQANAYRTGRM